MMRQKQAGSVLIIGLIMLVLITLLVVSAFNAASTNQKIVYHAQLTSENATVAQTAIDSTASNIAFMSWTAPQPITVGKHTVTVTTSCLKGRILPNKEATTVSTDCLWDPDSGGVYIEGKSSAAGDSLCAETLWDVQAATNHPFDDKASTEVHQGIGVKSARTAIASTCTF